MIHQGGGNFRGEMRDCGQKHWNRVADFNIFAVRSECTRDGFDHIAMLGIVFHRCSQGCDGCVVGFDRCLACHSARHRH